MPRHLPNALRTTRSTYSNASRQYLLGVRGFAATLARVKIYRGFPERLHHRVPYWVEPGTLFHVRIALDREKEQRALTNPPLAQEILDSAKFYEASLRWHVTLFLLMPDHLHALLSFARDQSMSEVIRDGNASMRESIISSGKKDISIIDCDLTNAVRNSRRR
jgi:hypothetical protein